MRSCNKIYVLVFTAGFFALAAGQAAARSISGLRCNVETTDIGSVTIGNINKAPDINNILSFSCSFRRPLAAGRRVAYCWHIHDAPGGTARFTYRYATLNRYNKLAFNIYSHDVKVGDRRTDYNIFGLAKKITDTEYRVDDPITVRFEGNAGISALPAGQYKYDNPQTHVVMQDVSDYEALDYKSACGNSNGDVTGTGNTKGNTNITVNVRTYCEVRVDKHLIFPAQYSLNNPVSTNGTVNVNCSAGTDYKVEIGNGNNYFNNMRHMKQKSGGQTIAYTVSPEKWTGVGLGTPQGQNQTIDGKVPAQTTPDADIYRDTLIVTVNIIR